MMPSCFAHKPSKWLRRIIIFLAYGTTFRHHHFAEHLCRINIHTVQLVRHRFLNLSPDGS